MNIKFENGTMVDYLIAVETEEYYNGANRRTLTLECDKNAISVDELNMVLSDENNIKSITLVGETYPIYKREKVTTKGVDENGQEVSLTNEVVTEKIELYETPEKVFADYTIKIKCGVESVLIKSETPNTPAVYEDRIVFKLGKPTYIEEQIKRLGL